MAAQQHYRPRTAVLVGGAVAVLFVLRSVLKIRGRRQAAAATPSNGTKWTVAPLPVTVAPEKLPRGWAVANPIYYPPRYAVTPLIVSSSADWVAGEEEANVTGERNRVDALSVEAFILFDDLSVVPPAVLSTSLAGHLSTRRAGLPVDEAAFFHSYAELVEMLREKVRKPVCIEPIVVSLPENGGPLQLHLGDQADAQRAEVLQQSTERLPCAFKYIAVAPDALVLFGSFSEGLDLIHTMVISGAGLSRDALLDCTSPTAQLLIQLLQATAPPPQSAHMVYLGSPVGSLDSTWRVQLTAADLTATLTIPGTLQVCAEPRSGPKCTAAPKHAAPAVAELQDEQVLLTLSDSAVADAAVNVTATSLVAMVRGERFTDVVTAAQGDFKTSATFPTSFLAKLEQVDVTMFAEEAGAGSDTNGMAVNSTPRRGPGSTSATVTEPAEVCATFYQPHIGVNFQVDVVNGVVRQVRLNDNACLVYYPIGEVAPSRETGRRGKANAATVSVPPQATMTLISELPQTWERFEKTTDADREEQIKHNILYHFTNWEKEQVPCKLGEINGRTCVQLNESAEGKACRTYVVPWADCILSIRWETKQEEWEACLPLLHTLLDTLHLTVPQRASK